VYDSRTPVGGLGGSRGTSLRLSAPRLSTGKSNLYKEASEEARREEEGGEGGRLGNRGSFSGFGQPSNGSDGDPSSSRELERARWI